MTIYSLVYSFSYLAAVCCSMSSSNCGFLTCIHGEGNGYPLWYSCLENPMDGGAWYAAVHGVAKSGTRLSDITFTFHFHTLEKEMATHSSVLAWRNTGTREPGGLPSMGLQRVGHNWSILTAAAAVLHTDFSRARSGGLVFSSLSDFFSLLWSTQSKALA